MQLIKPIRATKSKGTGKIKYLQKDRFGDLKKCFPLFEIHYDSVLDLIKDTKTNHDQKSMYIKFILRNKLRSLNLHNIQTLMFITRFLSTQAYWPILQMRKAMLMFQVEKECTECSDLSGRHSLYSIDAKLYGTDIQEKQTQNLNSR